MRHNNESLNELLDRFMDFAQAAQAQRDIREGDRLFEIHPVTMRKETAGAIKARVQREFRKQRQASIAKWSSLAAGIAIALLAGVQALKDEPVMPVVQKPVYVASNTQNLWSRLSSGDSLLLVMDQELTDVANSINDIESEDAGSVNMLSIDLLEIEELEMIASNTDFWKG